MKFLPWRPSSIGCVDVCVQRLDRWHGARMSSGHGHVHLLGGQTVNRIELTSRQFTRREYTTTESRDRIVHFSGLCQLFFGAVGLRITAIVSMDAGAACLNEARAAAGTRTSYC